MSVLSTAGKALGVGLNVGVPTWQAYSDIKDGKGVVKSVAKAGVDWAIGDAMMGFLGMGPGLALMGAGLAVGAADMALESGRENARGMKKAYSGTGVMGRGIEDSQYTATMRQRQLQQMGGHTGIARQALGSEARRRAAGIRY